MTSLSIHTSCHTSTTHQSHIIHSTAISWPSRQAGQVGTINTQTAGWCTHTSLLACWMACFTNDQIISILFIAAYIAKTHLTSKQPSSQACMHLSAIQVGRWPFAYFALLGRSGLPPADMHVQLRCVPCTLYILNCSILFLTSHISQLQAAMHGSKQAFCCQLKQLLALHAWHCLHHHEVVHHIHSSR